MFIPKSLAYRMSETPCQAHNQEVLGSLGSYCSGGGTSRLEDVPGSGFNEFGVYVRFGCSG